MALMFGKSKPAPASAAKPSASSSTAAGSSSKKLADFYNVKASASKRFKAVLKFVESVEKTSPNEVSEFFDKDHETIFTVFWERWNKAETQDKVKKKEKDFQQTLMNIILFMKHFMIYAPNLIARKWKYTEFAKVIDRHLSKGCKAAIRLAAFEVLLLFISNLKTGIDEQLFLFQNAINLNPFQGRSGLEDQSCLIPSNTEPTVDDGVALWELLLTYITHREAEFDYWSELIKARYFVVFFPQICQELGLKVDHSRGFSTCPHPLLRSLVNQIAVWAENPQICAVLWAPKNGLLMMEILRQSAMMNVKDYHATIKRSTDTFRLFLMNPLLTNKLIGEQNPILQTYWRLFIRGIAEIFLLPSAEPELPVHMALCKDVLSSYTVFSLDYAKKMHKATWDVLQMTLLEFTHTMFKRGNPLAENLTNQIADEMVNKLLFIWIASQTTTEDMWLAFKDKIGQLLEWKATVTQWKEKMVQLTHVLNDFFYRIPLKEDTAASERSGSLGAKSSPLNIRETKVTVLSWDEESIKTTWFGTLHILGNLNRITEPNNYAIAMSCMHDMIEILLKSEERLPPTEQPPIPLYQIFLPWLLEACAVDDKRSKGKILAYTILCKMFCRQHPFKMDVKFLSHFYRVIQLALSVGNPNLIWVIIQHGYMLFHLPLPGVSVLIPDFLREIDQMFRAENKVSVPELVQQRALTILISLICYPSHFGGLDSMNFSELELRARMSVTLNIACNYKQLSMPKNKVITIWGLCLLVFEEATTSGRKELIQDCLRTLAQDAVHPNEEVARNACDALSTIALVGEILEKIDPNMVLEVISSLCDDVVNLIEKGMAEGPANMREACITNHWNAILDLLMLTQTMAGIAPLIEKVFRTVEVGLLGELVTEDITEQPPAAAGSTPGSPDNMKSSQALGGARKVTNKPAAKLAGAAAFTALKNAPSHKSAVVRESTEIFLVNLLAHHNNFPSLAGPHQLVSRRGFDPRTQVAGYDETDLEEEGRTMYFVYHGQSIITVCQLKDSTVRVTFRDCVGKYTWDAKLHYEPSKLMVKAIETKRQTIQKARAAKPDPKPRVVEFNPPPHVPPPRRPEDQLPFYQAGDPISAAADSISDLVNYHKRHYPSQIGKDFMALDVNPQLDKEIADLVATLTFQSEDERLALDAGRNNRVPLPLAPPMPNPANQSHFHYARLFLSHMGLLSPEARPFLHAIDTGPKFRRHLRELDKINGRDIVKIGLIYVREGQEDQKDILRNVTRSKIYSQFVKGLGWNVTVKSHTGYVGGIERDGPAGSTAPYYATHAYEMMFHDITRMPNIETDEKCVNKKKHVGNDAVHVVWSESRQEYKAATITSQFNDVHIVIYPLFNGLFRCQVMQKEKLGSFGPIVDGMVLSKRLLPTLVRQTAYLANRAVRSIKEGFVRPNVTRQRLIKDVHDKYKIEKPVEEFLAALYPLVPVTRDELFKSGAGVAQNAAATPGETTGE